MVNNRIPISKYRRKTRVSLENQQGINTWLVFLFIIFTSVIQNLLDDSNLFPEKSIRQHLLSFLVDNLLLFASNYALFYIALVVVRGGRPKSNLLSSVFQRKCFGSIPGINLINSVINWLLNGLIFLPMFLIGGVSTYIQLLFSSNTVPTGVMPGDFLDISFVLSIVGMIPASIFVTSVVGDLLQFAVWTKLDYPNLSVIQYLKYGWFLLKDRIGTYILSQLSFIG